MNDESLFDMIRRLLALGETRDNEHEAAAAMAKAEELCRRYNLSREEVHARTDSAGEWEEATGWTGGATTPYHVHLASAVVQEFFFVRMVHVTRLRGKARQKELSLFGRKENVAVARHVLLFLIRTFWRLWTVYRTGKSSRDRRIYQLGLAQGLASRLIKERRQAKETEQNALVVVDAAIDRAYEQRCADLKPSRSKPGRLKRHNRQALEAGRCHGRQIEIRPAVPQTKQPLLF